MVNDHGVIFGFFKGFYGDHQEQGRLSFRGQAYSPVKNCPAQYDQNQASKYASFHARGTYAASS